jgi:beta-lactamase class A
MRLLEQPSVGVLWVIAALVSLMLPLDVLGGHPEYPDLRDCRDHALQWGLDSVVRDQGLWREARDGDLVLAVADITDPVHPRMAEINGDHMIYAASLPKIAILLGGFVQIERGRLQADAALYADMTDMIRYSDNAAATRVLDRVGRQTLLDVLQEPGFRLYDPAAGGGLWVGKAYAKKGAYRRDPLHGLSHGATGLAALRFYYLLETGRLVGADSTRRMKEILSEPGIRHKFVKGLARRPGVRMYRKSGTWRQYHADSALVEYGRHKYIIVGLVADRRGGAWLERLAPALHDLLTGDVTQP